MLKFFLFLQFYLNSLKKFTTSGNYPKGSMTLERLRMTDREIDEKYCRTN